MRTYGLYTFDAKKNTIVVELEPMTAIIFKRMFARAAQEAAASIVLTASEENARNLEWFMLGPMQQLMPKKVSDAKQLHALARAFDARMEALAATLRPDYVPPADGLELALPARPYQLTPAEIAVIAGGVLCLDEVGLGKTIEAIVLLAKRGGLPAVVSTLTHLPKQFEREIKRFLPQVTTYRLKRGSPLGSVRKKVGLDPRTGKAVFESRRAPVDLAKWLNAGNPMPDVIVTSYSKLPGWAEWIVKTVKPKTLILDEVQEVRHGFGKDVDPDEEDSDSDAAGKKEKHQRNRAVRFLAYAVDRRLGLTATPVYGSGSQIHPVMEVLVPGSLGTRAEFRREWCEGGNVKEPELLGKYLRDRGLVIGRTKGEVGRELPKLTISEQFCDSDPAIMDEMNKSSRAFELARFVLSGTRAAFKASGEFDLWVRQQTGLAKAPFVAAFVDVLLQSGEPVVLAGWHHAVYDIWAKLLEEHKPAFFHGKCTPDQKDEAIRRFRERETNLFILSLRAGAGIDGLQYAGCSNVVFGELDWSPAIHEQFIGRVRRDGILVPVTAWFLVADTGSDPEMASSLGIKRGQLEGIRDPEKKIVGAQADRDAIKRLARDFLEKRGMALPERPDDDAADEKARGGLGVAGPLFEAARRPTLDELDAAESTAAEEEDEVAS